MSLAPLSLAPLSPESVLRETLHRPIHMCTSRTAGRGVRAHGPQAAPSGSLGRPAAGPMGSSQPSPLDSRPLRCLLPGPRASLP